MLLIKGLTFNSLYWDFCSASWYDNKYTIEGITTAFNSLYWDFCSASMFHFRRRENANSPFNSLYWDFCSASRSESVRSQERA